MMVIPSGAHWSWLYRKTMVMSHTQKCPDADFRIRPLKPDDEPFLWKALYHAIHVPTGQVAPPPEIVHDAALARYVSAWMCRTGDLGFIAEKSPEPVGAAWLRQWSDDQRGFGFIDEMTPELSMSVLPNHRGEGIGTQLLRRLLSAADERFDRVSLSVAETNPARRLYEREGFISVGQVHDGSMTMMRKL